MLEVFKRNIMKLLKRSDYQPLKLSQVAKTLGVSSEDYAEFKRAFEELRRTGHVVLGVRNLVSLPAMSGRVIGTFRANVRGFGFITPLEPNAHGDLFVPPNATGEAMTGDIVAARVRRKGKRGGQMEYRGEVIEILERAKNRFVGTLRKKGDGWIVQPDGKGIVEPITVDDVGAKGAKHKDKVVVEILTYPTEKYLARGVIVEVLGKAGQYESEIRSIIRQYHLPSEFNQECSEEAHEAASGFEPENIKGREDITDKVIVTIDPPDAKDFDDAISIERDNDGNRVLGVHIADVSHFVKKDSALDVEAKERGNSVYLPGRVIPMLPEVLSNGVCSLQPGQRRFVKSAYLTYDEEGVVLSRRFANSVIKSTERLTYEQADRILKGHTKVAKHESVELVREMERLSRAIEKRRVENGMLHLDLPETELIMDESGWVVDAEPADDSYPHTIIEMFMVEANDAVAGLLDRLNIGFMRRIHPEPDGLSMKNLAKLVRAFGYNLGRNPDRRTIQDLLAAVKGTDSSFGVNLAILRSLEKAEYAPLNVGHYALASIHYCHFTSPIRRCADLLVHRVLEFYLQNRMDLAKNSSVELDLTEIGKHISFTEQRAEDSERELKTVLILQMLSERMGEQLDCVVTGLANFGVFVQSRKFGIEGLIQMEELGPDEWKYNQRAGCIEGRRTGLSIRLGQALKVRIVSVNVPGRQLNVAPVEPLATEVVRRKKGERKSRRERVRRRSRRKR